MCICLFGIAWLGIALVVLTGSVSIGSGLFAGLGVLLLIVAFILFAYAGLFVWFYLVLDKARKYMLAKPRPVPVVRVVYTTPATFAPAAPPPASPNISQIHLTVNTNAVNNNEPNHLQLPPSTPKPSRPASPNLVRPDPASIPNQIGFQVDPVPPAYDKVMVEQE